MIGCELSGVSLQLSAVSRQLSAVSLGIDVVVTGFGRTRRCHWKRGHTP